MAEMAARQAQSKHEDDSGGCLRPGSPNAGGEGAVLFLRRRAPREAAAGWGRYWAEGLFRVLACTSDHRSGDRERPQESGLVVGFFFLSKRPGGWWSWLP
jgi:hypothetical protein